MIRLALGSMLALSVTAAAAIGQTQPAPLVAFASAYAKITAYSTTAHVYQTDGDRTQNSVYQYSFTKPQSIALTIVSGPGAGTTVSWSGGTTARAASGNSAHDIDLTDPMVTSPRGTTIVAISFGSILAHAQETAGTLTTSTTAMDGATVDLVNIDVANPRGDNDLTREVVYLSQSTHFPVRVDGFIGPKLVQTISFDDTKPAT